MKTGMVLLCALLIIAQIFSCCGGLLEPRITISQEPAKPTLASPPTATPALAPSPSPMPTATSSATSVPIEDLELPVLPSGESLLDFPEVREIRFQVIEDPIGKLQELVVEDADLTDTIRFSRELGYDRVEPALFGILPGGVEISVFPVYVPGDMEDEASLVRFVSSGGDRAKSFIFDIDPGMGGMTLRDRSGTFAFAFVAEEGVYWQIFDAQGEPFAKKPSPRAASCSRNPGSWDDRSTPSIFWPGFLEVESEVDTSRSPSQSLSQLAFRPLNQNRCTSGYWDEFIALHGGSGGAMSIGTLCVVAVETAWLAAQEARNHAQAEAALTGAAAPSLVAACAASPGCQLALLAVMGSCVFLTTSAFWKAADDPPTLEFSDWVPTTERKQTRYTKDGQPGVIEAIVYEKQIHCSDDRSPPPTIREPVGGVVRLWGGVEDMVECYDCADQLNAQLVKAPDLTAAEIATWKSVQVEEPKPKPPASGLIYVSGKFTFVPAGDGSLVDPNEIILHVPVAGGKVTVIGRKNTNIPELGCAYFRTNEEVGAVITYDPATQVMRGGIEFIFAPCTGIPPDAGQPAIHSFYAVFKDGKTIKDGEAGGFRFDAAYDPSVTVE